MQQNYKKLNLKKNKMEKIKFVFFGTDEFSVKVVETLKQRGYLPNLIVTVPDKPQGRKLKITAPPIKIWGEENKIEVFQPESLRNDNVIKKLEVANLSFAVVASYGKIIPDKILRLPIRGCLNIHPSLLPKYRGATPIESAIINGEKFNGISIILLDEEMDHGPLVAQKKISISDNTYYPEIRDLYATSGGELLADILPDWLAQKIKPIEQNHLEATYTKKITKSDGLISLSDHNQINYNKIRALTPWPGAYFILKQKDRDLKIIITQADLLDNQLKIKKVKPEGKREMDWESFENGYQITKPI